MNHKSAEMDKSSVCEEQALYLPSPELLAGTSMVVVLEAVTLSHIQYNLPF